MVSIVNCTNSYFNLITSFDLFMIPIGSNIIIVITSSDVLVLVLKLAVK